MPLTYNKGLQHPHLIYDAPWNKETVLQPIAAKQTTQLLLKRAKQRANSNNN